MQKRMPNSLDGFGIPVILYVISNRNRVPVMTNPSHTPAAASELVELYADQQGAAYRLRGHVFPIRRAGKALEVKLTNLITVRVYNARDAVDAMVTQYNKTFFRK